eukprot:12004676-Alexandrium_andersonii.AAC.1
MERAEAIDRECARKQLELDDLAKLCQQRKDEASEADRIKHDLFVRLQKEEVPGEAPKQEIDEKAISEGLRKMNITG